MFNVIKFITFAQDAGQDDRTRLVGLLEAAPGLDLGIVNARLQPTLAGSHSGGDLIWRLQFADERAYRACIQRPDWRRIDRALTADMISNLDTAAYLQEAQGLSEPSIKNGVYRALLLTTRPGVSAAQLAQYESEQREMALYMPTIRNWALNRVVDGGGARRWDYVWEQEFQDYDQWNRSYMAHPYHWARIHRWFDPESTDWIHDPWYALCLCRFEDSILSGKA